MAINTQIWGTESDYEPLTIIYGGTQSVYFADMQADTPSSVTWTGMGKGLLAWGLSRGILQRGIGIDNSICFWGARVSNSDDTFADYVHLYADNNALQQVVHTHTQDVVPLALCVQYPGYNTNMIQANNKNWTYNDGNNHPWSPTDTTAAMTTTFLSSDVPNIPNIQEISIAPILKYSVADFRYLICVECTNGTSVIHCDLYHYTQVYQQYPYINAVVAIPFSHTTTAADFVRINWGVNDDSRLSRPLTMIPILSRTIDSDAYTNSNDITVYRQHQMPITDNQYIFTTADADPTTTHTISLQPSRGMLVAGLAGQTYADSYYYLYAGNHMLIPGGKNFIITRSGTNVLVRWEMTSQQDVENFVEYCFTQFAYLGLAFSDRYYGVIDHTTNNNLHMGIRDTTGCTTGAWVSGAEISDRIPAYSWTDPARETIYDPTKTDTDPNKYVNTMPHTQRLALQNFYRLYSLDLFTILFFPGYFSYIPTKTADYSSWDDYQLYLAGNFLNSNPLDNIIFLKWYPIKLTDYCIVENPVTETVRISNTLAEYPITPGSSNIVRITGTTSGNPYVLNTLKLGNFKIYSAYNNFLDYEPYSSAKLYLPYASTVDIDLKNILGKTLYVQYKIDFRTGTATAYVTESGYDGIVIATAPAHISVDIPITGIQSADYQNAIYQAVSNLKNAAINQFTSYVQTATAGIRTAATLTNPLAALSGLSNIAISAAGASSADQGVEDAQYHLNAAPIRHTMVSATSPGDAALMYQYPALIVNRPKMLDTYDADVYAHTVGNACIVQIQLSECDGFTVVSAVDLSGVNATHTELKMISQLLMTGIYL